MSENRESIYAPIGPYDVDGLIERLAMQPDFMVLRSASVTPEYGQWTYLCFDAFATFYAKGSHFLWCNERIEMRNPFDFLQQRLNEYALQKNPRLPAFQGGAVGYIGYEAGGYLDDLPQAVDGIGLPDVVMNFYSTIVAIDEVTGLGYIIASGFPEKDGVKRKTVALDDIEKVKALLQGTSSRAQQGSSGWSTMPHPEIPRCVRDDVRAVTCSDKPVSNFDVNSYCDAVNQVKAYIRQGDVFQANITQQFRANVQEGFHPLSLYSQLMKRNPAPFSAFLTLSDDSYLISASPERFIKLDDQKVETCPIKGTRKRSEETDEDAMLAKSLQTDEKDRAENVMIVDLMRNDLSRVCQAGSIEVPSLCSLKSYATVHHLVSTVRGTLKDELQAFDVLQATFPPGSVTGAPKIRAMEIIHEIEKKARGPYCGCFGYWSFTGDMDTAVTIRTYFIHKNQLFFSAGGAVVLDSCAQSEYQESLQKAKALLEVLQGL